MLILAHESHWVWKRRHIAHIGSDATEPWFLHVRVIRFESESILYSMLYRMLILGHESRRVGKWKYIHWCHFLWYLLLKFQFHHMLFTMEFFISISHPQCFMLGTYPAHLSKPWLRYTTHMTNSKNAPHIRCCSTLFCLSWDTSEIWWGS